MRSQAPGLTRSPPRLSKDQNTKYTSDDAVDLQLPNDDPVRLESSEDLGV